MTEKIKKTAEIAADSVIPAVIYSREAMSQVAMPEWHLANAVRIKYPAVFCGVFDCTKNPIRIL